LNATLLPNSSEAAHTCVESLSAGSMICGFRASDCATSNFIAFAARKELHATIGSGAVRLETPWLRSILHPGQSGFATTRKRWQGDTGKIYDCAWPQRKTSHRGISVEEVT
jgi:hypothetical protein